MRNRQQGLETPTSTKEQILKRIDYIKNQSGSRVAPENRHSDTEGIGPNDINELQGLFDAYVAAYNIMENCYNCMIEASSDDEITTDKLNYFLNSYTISSNKLLEAKRAYYNKFKNTCKKL